MPVLVNAGATPDARGADGFTAWQKAVRGAFDADECEKCLESLRIGIPRVAAVRGDRILDKPLTDALMGAARRGWLEPMRQLSSWGADVDAKMVHGGDSGVTLLMSACASGDVEAAQFALDKSSWGVGEMDSNGEGVLFYAAGSGSPEVIRFMIRHGARGEIRNKDGKLAWETMVGNSRQSGDFDFSKWSQRRHQSSYHEAMDNLKGLAENAVDGKEMSVALLSLAGMLAQKRAEMSSMSDLTNSWARSLSNEGVKPKMGRVAQ